MRSLLCILTLIFVLSIAGMAAETAKTIAEPAKAAVASTKITINAQSKPLKDVVQQMSDQSGVSIVLDPKVQANITISLKDTDLSQALDVVAKMNNLKWKKLQFAKTQDVSVSLDQLKSAITALESLPLAAVAVEDPASKKSAMFAKDMSKSLDTAAVALPEGYAWTSVYLILSNEADKTVAETKTDTASAERVKQLADADMNMIKEMASMSPEQRQQIFAQEWTTHMSMTPEARRSLLKDRMTAMFNLDPQYRNQLREDMHSIGHEMRQQGQNMHGMPGGDHGNRGNGN